MMYRRVYPSPEKPSQSKDNEKTSKLHSDDITNFKNINKTPQNISHDVYDLPDDGVGFEIHNIRQLMKTGNRYVCTCYYYTQPCKCRVRVKFEFLKIERHGNIEVTLLVAPGVYDKCTEWPVTLTGTICLLDLQTKEYSECFKVHGRLLSAPIDEEVTLAAIPCKMKNGLSESRVTYGDLISWGHIEDNSMFVKWFVKAVK